MTTHTIEVTDVDEDLLRRLDQRAHQQGQDRSAYLRDLVQRDLARQGAKAADKTFTEILTPIHDSVRWSGMSDEEVVGLLDETLADVRRERGQRNTSENEMPPS